MTNDIYTRMHPITCTLSLTYTPYRQINKLYRTPLGDALGRRRIAGIVKQNYCKTVVIHTFAAISMQNTYDFHIFKVYAICPFFQCQCCKCPMFRGFTVLSVLTFKLPFDDLHKKALHQLSRWTSKSPFYISYTVS